MSSISDATEIVKQKQKYVCNRCKARYDEPAEYRYRENLDGEHGWTEFTVLYCPECGSENIDEVDAYGRDMDEL